MAAAGATVKAPLLAVVCVSHHLFDVHGPAETRSVYARAGVAEGGKLVNACARDRCTGEGGRGALCIRHGHSLSSAAGMVQAHHLPPQLTPSRGSPGILFLSAAISSSRAITTSGDVAAI